MSVCPELCFLATVGIAAYVPVNVSIRLELCFLAAVGIAAYDSVDVSVSPEFYCPDRILMNRRAKTTITTGRTIFRPLFMTRPDPM